MAGERKLPAVGKVISGTHGYFWWNNSICYEITSFEAKIKTNRETINFSGQMWDDSKLMGVSGTWTAKIKKIYSRKLEDPDNGGTERVQLMSCWLDELTLQAFENGKITEDEFSGGFVGFKYLDTIADPCV